MNIKIHNGRMTSGSLMLGGFLLLFSAGMHPVRAQSDHDKELVQQMLEQAETAYRVSTDLLNGEKYHYPYRRAAGTPFLELAGDPLAMVQIDGKEYPHQRVRYDMYNQIMVLDYTDVAGARGSLILKNEWIDQVTMGGYTFRVFMDETGKERYGQVIGEGEYTCIYFWEKQYLPDMHNGEEHYFFTDPGRKAFIQYREGRCSYKRNRTMLKCLPESLRSRTREYLKTRRIRVHKATFQEIEGLLSYINQLGNE
jgi:hypothetical protein